MARKVEHWQSDNGKTFDNELDALRADVSYWKNRALDAEKGTCKKVKTHLEHLDDSSYGSSGGGGHD